MIRHTALGAAALLLTLAATGCGQGADVPGEQAATPSGPVLEAPETAPSLSITVTGPEAEFCQAAVEAGLARNVQALREAIDDLAVALPDSAGPEVIEGLDLLREFYGEAEDLLAAGRAYAEADPADQARMDVYFAFQSETCD